MLWLQVLGILLLLWFFVLSVTLVLCVVATGFRYTFVTLVLCVVATGFRYTLVIHYTPILIYLNHTCCLSVCLTKSWCHVLSIFVLHGWISKWFGRLSANHSMKTYRTKKHVPSFNVKFQISFTIYILQMIVCVFFHNVQVI